ncbi:MAG: glycosyltransferase [Desulfobacterales bacterium]|nr:MAG: glycosyltransferase [Desulfobacterales bacterium]
MGKCKSVLVLTTSFPLESSIAFGSFVFEKCRHLIKEGLQVKVIAPHHMGAKKRAVIDGIKINRFQYFFPAKFQMLAYRAGIPTNIRTSYLAKIQLPFFLFSFFVATVKEARHYDILHCHWSIAGLIGIVAAKIYKKKIVLMMHGAEVFVLGNHPILRWILRNVDFLICNSSFTEKKTLAVYPVKHHVVIAPGVDIHRYYPQNKTFELRKSLNISEADIFILTIGNFIPRKGFEYLIEALNIIVNQKGIANIKLGIGGRGPLKSKYEGLIKNYSLIDNTIFLGFINDHQMPAYYTLADIFVLPSIVDGRGDTEGLGVVLLEANACKTPIIGSRVGGIPDIIQDGVNGLTCEQKNPVDLAEKIIKLADNKNLREQMGENGRKIIKDQFNWERIAKRIIRIYDSGLR